MNTSVGEKINRDFRLLNRTQQELVVGYGFRQIKYMIENDLPRAELIVPDGAEIQGVNNFGRWQAINTKEQKRYGYFPHNNEWSQMVEYEGGGDVENLSDFQRIYKLFNLKMLTLDELFNLTTPLLERVSKEVQARS